MDLSHLAGLAAAAGALAYHTLLSAVQTAVAAVERDFRLHPEKYDGDDKLENAAVTAVQSLPFGWLLPEATVRGLIRRFCARRKAVQEGGADGRR